MSLNDVIFIDSLPKLDLHGYDRETAEVAINDFINDQVKMHHELITIVHGVGSGILRNKTKETLLKNKSVIEFKLMYNNFGCTIVRIKFDK